MTLRLLIAAMAIPISQYKTVLRFTNKFPSRIACHVERVETSRDVTVEFSHGIPRLRSE